jgi:endoglucanase
LRNTVTLAKKISSVIAVTSLIISQFCGVPALSYKSPEAYNKLLGIGINLGNALDAPKEGDWGVTLQPEYFPLIKEAGFTHVRVPICWSAHAMEQPPYTVEGPFFDRVDWAMKQALDQSLLVVLNVHHYVPLEKSPASQKDRFLALWQQIAHHYKDAPDTVAFEIYNEPSAAMDEAIWGELFAAALKIIRAENAHRIVIIGPPKWNSINSLPTLKLPDDDPDLIATVHYYAPFHFTHQNASWVGPQSKQWLGTKWTDSTKERQQISLDFDKARAWAIENKREIYLGEFGAYEQADMASRALWTRAVREEANKHNFSSAYWEFCSGFGAYDPVAKAWREPLLKALIEKR